MNDLGRLGWLGVGLVLGITSAAVAIQWTPPRAYGANDRHEDYVLCTGPVLVNPRVPSDGIWLLDYRTGRLMGTVINHLSGTIAGWAEVDMVKEFDIPPRSDVHFLMTCGVINNGQSALYVAETTTGKFGVYTMGIRPDNQSGMMIQRHSISNFRATSQGDQGNLIPTAGQGIQPAGIQLPGAFPGRPGMNLGAGLPGNPQPKGGFKPIPVPGQPGLNPALNPNNGPLPGPEGVKPQP